jgi:hypothetical protein
VSAENTDHEKKMLKILLVRIALIPVIVFAFALNAMAVEPDAVLDNTTGSPAVNKQVTAAYDVLLSISGSQRPSDLLGQEHWRKLRDEACFFEGHAATDAVACFQHVDDERLRELDDLIDIRRTELETQSVSVDLEKLLDQPIDLSVYSPPSDLYFDGSMRIERLPKTCRELYTLTAGAWHYIGDTIGMNTEENAFDACRSLLFLAQSRAPKRKSQIDFSDVKLYANEIMCIALRCDDDASIPETPTESFEAQKQHGNLIIESANLPMWGLDACNDALVIQPPFFCFDGMNVRLEASASADYTGSGNTEAVVNVEFFPTQGSQRLHYLFLASYDAHSQSIRVKQIDWKARIKLITEK